MSNMLRRIKRQQDVAKEKIEIKNIKNTFGIKPKEKCPKCKLKTIFYTNDQEDVYCVRCEQKIGNRKYMNK